MKPNVEGTQNMVKAAESCPLFIHISSSSVYLPEDEPIHENKAGSQDNSELSAYGLSKLYSEQEVYKNRNTGSTYILRARAFYGVGDTQIVPRMLKFVKGNKLQLPGELQNKLSMTHYDNMGHAIECCIEQSKSGIHVYNVSDDEVYIMREVLGQLMGALYDRSLKVKQVPLWLIRFFAKYKIGGITPLLVRAVTKDMVLDISAIKKELNYQPKQNLDRALPELAQWVRHIGGPEELRNPEKFLSWDLK